MIYLNALTIVVYSFSKNAKRVSSLFRDRPITPANSIVYWTEYLIRHGEETNIRPTSAEASWTNHLMIDLGATLAVIIFVTWFFTRKIIQIMLLKLKQR